AATRHEKAMIQAQIRLPATPGSALRASPTCPKIMPATKVRKQGAIISQLSTKVARYLNSPLCATLKASGRPMWKSEISSPKTESINSDSGFFRGHGPSRRPESFHETRPHQLGVGAVRKGHGLRHSHDQGDWFRYYRHFHRSLGNRRQGAAADQTRVRPGRPADCEPGLRGCRPDRFQPERAEVSYSALPGILGFGL